MIHNLVKHLPGLKHIKSWLRPGFILLSTLLTIGVGNAKADITYSGGKIYFADIYDIDAGNIQLCARQSSWTGVSTMSNIGHTKLYYILNPQGSGWGGILGWVVISDATAKSNSNFDNWTEYSWCSDWNTYGFNSGSTYLIVPSSADKNKSVTTTYYSGGYSALNHNQTVYKYTSSGGTTPASYTAQSVASGTITISAYKMTGDGTASNASNSGTISAAATTSLAKSAAYTGEVTLTASPNAGYSFIGWFGSTSATTALSTETTYTYNAPNEAKSIYARFKAEETHDVTVYYKYGSTTVQASTTESAVGVTTERTFTAPVIDGYNFYSYTFGSGLTNKTTTTTNPCRFVTKASGTYELTVNYAIAPVKLLYGTSTPLNSPSNTAMTYDATKKAYYVDVTTTASPYYFRFDFNNGTDQYSGDWNTYPDVNAVTANGDKVSCSIHEIKDWDNKPSLKFTGASGSAIRIWFSYKDKQAWITETTYTVSVASGGNGTVSPASVTAGKNTSSATIAATPNTGYYFKNWTKSTSNITIASATSASTTVKATSTGTVTANFSPQWTLAGSGTELGAWNTTANPFTGYVTSAGKDKGYFSATLLPNTTYEVKVYDTKNSKWYGLASGASTVDVYYSTASTEWTMTNTTGNKNLYVHTSSGGTYTFEWNLTDKKLKVNYPTSWYITMGKSGSGSVSAVDNESNTITNGQFVKDNATVTWTATPSTGYDLEGWYSNSGCTTKYVHNGTTVVINDAAKTIALSGINADKTVYAKFTPKKTTITYSQSGTGYGSGGPSTTKIATYGSTMPSISGSVPTAANGYAFMGYYDAAGGEGTKYYTETGASARTWNKTASTATLHAYFKKAEIVDLDIDPSLAEKGGTVKVTPDIDPTPAGTTSVCYYLLYMNGNKVDPQPDFGNPNSSGLVSFTAPNVAGTFILAAALRTGSSCGGGTLLDSVATHTFQVGGEYNVTIKYMCGTTVIKEQTRQGANPVEYTSISAPDIFGYTFSTWEIGDGITKHPSDALTKKDDFRFTASYDGTITAIYTKKSIFYFKNTLGWSNVYVNFMSNQYWDAYKGSGNQNNYYSRNNAMSLVPGTTDIYYIEYTGSTSEYITFTSKSQDNAENFWGKNPNVQVVVPTRPNNDGSPQTDFGYHAGTNMFVPLNTKVITKNTGDGGGADYYNRGYWLVYDPITGYTGYTLEVYNKTNDDGGRYIVKEIPFTINSDGLLEAVVDLEAKTGYGIKFRRDDGMRYTNVSQTLTNDTERKFEYHPDNWAACGLQSTAAGNYVFTINCSSSDGFLYLKAHFPAAVNDFQVMYYDNAAWSGSSHASTWRHPSRIIEARAGGVDTISFFVAKNNSPTLYAHYAYSINAGTGAITWKALNIAGASSKSLTVDSSAVWNFKVTQSTAGVIYSIENIGAYTGDYYIRCDAMNSKWDFYRSDLDHKMTYSAFSESAANSFGEKFSHYKAKWCPRGTNVKFVIANDYSPCISDTLIRDVNKSWPENMDVYGKLNSDGSADVTKDKWSANIRFMWNRHTNKISRAYVASATNVTRKFLVLRGCDAKIHDHNNNAIPATTYLAANEVLLEDDQNWIYETTIKVQPEARVKLYACYGEDPASVPNAQYFRGKYDSNNCGSDDNSIQILGGTGSKYYLMRVIYDFKTNRLITAWLPDGTAVDQAPLNIDADVMVIRDHQQGAEAITFTTNTKSLGQVKTVYGTMRFNRWTLSNRYRSSDTNNPTDPSKWSTTETDINKDHCKDASTISRYHAPLPTNLQTSSFERNNYFISFPFDVQLSEVFGFGTYGTHWIISKYNGLRRAQVGYFRDNCINGDFDCTNWDYIWDRTGVTLKAYEGYLLSLDLDLMQYDDTTNFWLNQIHQVELYFPSKVPMSTITTTNVTLPGMTDDYLCTKNYNKDGTNPEGDRRVKDSYWRCIGVPSYAPYGTVLKTGETEIQWNTDYTWYEDQRSFPFLYEWNTTDNTLTPQRTKTFNFKPLHSYLVQNKNTITWTAVSATPSSIVRRQRTEAQQEYTWRLNLTGDDNDESDTYIRMTDDEEVTEGFDFGPDMIKKLRDGYIVDANGDPIWDSSIDDYKQGVLHSDIYSILGYEYLAANSIPLNTTSTTIIPIGVRLKKAGEFTLSMPDGTYGVSITLVDNNTGARTELGAGFTYSFESEAGQYDDRFYLEIAKIKDVATGTEEIGEPSKSDVRKVMINGILYIVRGDQIFDALGNRVE
ncbi:MAG: hypothetical protein IJS57_04495 [Paludibacteraceae bacterium]|nr:hypothetical protein [Paludibacteraceae bacterium]